MTNRKIVKAELNKNRDKDIQELADLDIENRDKQFEDEPNRYGQILEERRHIKLEREELKKTKVHIWNRKHIEKRAIAEAEEQQS